MCFFILLHKLFYLLYEQKGRRLDLELLFCFYFLHLFGSQSLGFQGINHDHHITRVFLARRHLYFERITVLNIIYRVERKCWPRNRKDFSFIYEANKQYPKEEYEASKKKLFQQFGCKQIKPHDTKTIDLQRENYANTPFCFGVLHIHLCIFKQNQTFLTQFSEIVTLNFFFFWWTVTCKLNLYNVWNITKLNLRQRQSLFQCLFLQS